MSNAALQLWIQGDALPLAEMESILQIAPRLARDDMHHGYSMSWIGTWAHWTIEDARAGRANGAAIEALRLVEHLEKLKGGLSRVLATERAFGQIVAYYSKTLEASLGFPPATLNRVAALNLSLLIMWE